MTQQEAIAVLQEFYDYNKTLTPHGESWLQADITINRETQRNLAEALPLAIEAMRGPVHDPITGLELAIKAWNTAMGYTAPPRPGAIGPEQDGTAPIGDKGEES